MDCVDHWWNDTSRRKPKYSKENKSQCHFVYHKSHIDWPWVETWASAVKGTTSMNHGVDGKILFVLGNFTVWTHSSGHFCLITSDCAVYQFL